MNGDDERDYAEEAYNRRTMLQENISEHLAEAVPAAAAEDLDILSAAFAEHAWGTTEPKTSPDEQFRWTCKCGVVIKVGLTGSMSPAGRLGRYSVDMTRLHLFTEMLRALADAGRLAPAGAR